MFGMCVLVQPTGFPSTQRGVRLGAGPTLESSGRLDQGDTHEISISLGPMRTYY